MLYSRVAQSFCKEAALIKQLKHNNILPFYGVLADDPKFYMVFPWYKNGNIMDYLERNPDVDRYDLASISSQPHTFGS